MSNIKDDWWEEVILLAGAHSNLSDATRAYLIEQLLLRETLASDAEHNNRHLIMAGLCAVDMASYLPGPAREAVESALHQHMTQVNAPSRLRLTVGEILDDLGWIPVDLYKFISVSIPSLDRQSAHLIDNPDDQYAHNFYIAKYPTTNLQYRRFLEAEDYADPAIWKAVVAFDADGRLQDLGDEAWAWFRHAGGKSRRPRYWDDPQFGLSRRCFPVVGVTWYEAAAYCAWLTRRKSNLDIPETKMVPGKYFFRLPLEAEWVQAAGGDEAERYPWDKSQKLADIENGDIKNITTRTNISEADLDHTSPVAMHTAGASWPYGLMDMAGNASEWQANLYENGKNYRALRGGSWELNRTYAYVAARDRYSPDYYWHYSGFRVVASIVNGL